MTPADHGVKVCRDCKQIKQRSEFYNADTYDGKQPYCIPCLKVRSVRSQKKNKINGMSKGQRERVEKGLCMRCSRPRGENGTGTLCRKDADLLIQQNLKRRQKLIAARVCIECRRPLEKNRTAQRCKICQRGAGRRASTLKVVLKKYGMTPDQYLQMLDAQNGRCAICDKADNNGKRLAVDHCHASNRVRQLLCDACNAGLGHFRDSPELLIKAQSYLVKHSVS